MSRKIKENLAIERHRQINAITHNENRMRRWAEQPRIVDIKGIGEIFINQRLKFLEIWYTDTLINYAYD